MSTHRSKVLKIQINLNDWINAIHFNSICAGQEGESRSEPTEPTEEGNKSELRFSNFTLSNICCTYSRIQGKLFMNITAGWANFLA